MPRPCAASKSTPPGEEAMSMIVTVFFILARASRVMTGAGIVLKIKSNVPAQNKKSFRFPALSEMTDAWATASSRRAAIKVMHPIPFRYWQRVRAHLPYPSMAQLLPRRFQGLWRIASQMAPSAVAIVL